MKANERMHTICGGVDHMRAQSAPNWSTAFNLLQR